MDKVVHFEVPFDDKKRAHKFYSEVFGWKLNPMPEMKYTIVHTVEVDEKMMPKESGAINGGMYNRADGGSKHPVLVIDVPNIDEHVKKITSRGGSVFMPKHGIGEMGWYAQVKDTEGNIIGVWETLKK